jgi:hypothetical protein
VTPDSGEAGPLAQLLPKKSDFCDGHHSVRRKTPVDFIVSGPGGVTGMITVPELASEALGSFLASNIQRRFGFSNARMVEIIPSIARLAMECIGNSDALYHNVEHTMLVTLAGHDILRGRALHSHVAPDDYMHLIIACLMHDIGYVRGILKGDDKNGFIADASGRKVTLPRGSSDAALFLYHVDRSKLFVLERIASMDAVDEERIARAIEYTRFPNNLAPTANGGDEIGELMRAADFIGQLGDPHYIRKANALYHEFEEAGLNRQFGYNSPADLVTLYPRFYWENVYPQIQTAIRYLNVTSRGRQWIANLHSNVFQAERNMALSGPQQ